MSISNTLFSYPQVAISTPPYMTDFSADDAQRALEDSLRATGGVEEPKRTRLRFTGLQVDRTPGGRCTASVELEWVQGDSRVGRAEGVSSYVGDLRVVAEATLRAIEHYIAAAGATVTLEVLGVKTMRAFDANIVMVSVLSNTSEGQRRLLGCNLSEDDHLRGAVIATLQATNRVLGNAIATR